MAQVAARPRSPAPSASALFVPVTADEVAYWWRETWRSGPWPDRRRCEAMAEFINSRRPVGGSICPNVKKVLSAYNLLILRYDDEKWTERPPPDEVATFIRILRRDRDRLKPAPAMWKQLLKFGPLLWLYAKSDFENARYKPSRPTDNASRTSPPVQFVALALRRLGYRKSTAAAVEQNLAAWRGRRQNRADRHSVADQPADRALGA
jgi:hypothetical protein